MQKCIAVDIDEVLVPFVNTLSHYHQKKVRQPISIPLRHAYHYASLFNLTEKESSDLVREFYSSEEHARMDALPGARWGLDSLKKKGYSISLVTGRQKYSRDATENLITRLFGHNAVDDIIFCDHYTEFAKKKHLICESLGAKYLIDDDFNQCSNCLNIGIPSYNFIGNPVYPWCDETTISVKDWEQVLKKVD